MVLGYESEIRSDLRSCTDWEYRYSPDAARSSSAGQKFTQSLPLMSAFGGNIADSPRNPTPLRLHREFRRACQT
jgi:hypothetical protein